jgi:hypothetical protein
MNHVHVGKVVAGLTVKLTEVDLAEPVFGVHGPHTGTPIRRKTVSSGKAENACPSTTEATG